MNPEDKTREQESHDSVWMLGIVLVYAAAVVVAVVAAAIWWRR